MKILFTCTYSSGISGVWNRVYNIAKELIKRGHEVHVFSSNKIFGTKDLAQSYEIIDGIHCHRFNVKTGFGSKNAFIYSKKEILAKLREIKPDVVDCQTYRHYEGTIVSNECKKLGIPCFLTTHAPFVDPRVRGRWLTFLAKSYDTLIGKRTLKNFNKIIAITKWEYPYLRGLGVNKEYIFYVPNGIPSAFFDATIKSKTAVKKILFFGRIAPVKDVETLIEAFALVRKKNRKVKLCIVGPIEENYKKKLDELVSKLKVKNIEFGPAIFDLDKKIELYKSAEVFVLPSKREGMPQSLIEAMASGCIVIASDIPANIELIKKDKTGYIFEQGDEKKLSDKIRLVIGNYKRLGNMGEEAREFAAGFTWKKITDTLENLYKESID